MFEETGTGGSSGKSGEGEGERKMRRRTQEKTAKIKGGDRAGMDAQPGEEGINREL